MARANENRNSFYAGTFTHSSVLFKETIVSKDVERFVFCRRLCLK